MLNYSVNKHLFVIVYEENRKVDIGFFVCQFIKTKYNILLEKDNINKNN